MHLRGVRFLRQGLVALIAAVLLWVVLDYARTWRSRVRVVQQAAKILSSEMIRSADSIEYSENEGGKQRFRIRANKLLETRQGKSLLEGIEAFDFNPDGSPKNHIRSQRAEYDRESGQVLFTGDVRIQMGKDIELRAESLFYDLKNNIGQTDDTMYLSSPQARGSARGVRYDNARRILELHGQTDLEVVRKATRDGRPAPDEKSRITSNSLYYSEADRFVIFKENARLESADASLSGMDIEARLSENKRHITSLMCAGNAEYRATKAGQEQVLRGDRIDFGINPALNTLEKIVVNGNARFASGNQEGQYSLQGGQIQLDLDPADGALSKIRSTSAVQFDNRRAGSATSISGEDLQADFSRETKLLERLRVKQNARMNLGSGDDLRADELTADEILFDFMAAAGQSRPTRLQAEGSVRWTSPPGDPAGRRKSESGRVLTATRLEMKYGPSGESLESGHASGGVRIAVLPSPAAASAPVRSLSAERVRFTFHESGNRLKTLDGEENVHVSYQSPVKQAAAEGKTGAFDTRSRNLRAVFRAEDGAMERASQWGDFTYEDGERTARAGRSDYDVRSGTLVLTEAPEVVDPTSKTTGRRLEYRIEDKMVVVQGDVRSVILPSKPGRADTPFLSSAGSGAPTVVTAEQMRYWSESPRVEYSGAVNMLSEGGQLRARTVDILDSGNEITATGDVLHTIDRRSGSAQSGVTREMPAASAKTSTGPGGAPLLVNCQTLRYERARNLIRYDGKVALESGDLRMWSHRLDAVLDSEGKQIEWARATGSLRILQTARQARGDQGDYFLGPGKFVVIGNPAEISDPERGKSVARRLTFYASDDRILLENS